MVNYVDLIIILIVIFFAWLGYLRGFIRDTLDLVVMILALVVSAFTYPALGQLLKHAFSLPQSFANAGAFFLIWFAIEFVYYIFNIFWFNFIPEEIREASWNSWAGLVPGAIRGIILVWLVLNIFFILPFANTYKNTVSSSLLGAVLVKSNGTVGGYIDKTFGSTLQDTINFLTVKPDSIETIQLGYTVANPDLEPQKAQDMLILINQERVKDGKEVLVFDAKLAEVAEAHGRDMFARGYFSHNTPEGLSPFDRMNAAGIKYLAAGENLALAPDLKSAHNGLMNSPGHRANILSADFNRVGIAVLDGGSHGKIFVQEFTN